MTETPQRTSPRQRTYEEVEVGDTLPVVTYPLPVHRLVLAAGGTRDYTAIHHNDAYARATGAPAMYANAILLQGMWERAVRDWIGSAGTVRALRGFRMRRFTLVGSLARVEGTVVDKRRERETGVVEIAMRTLVEDAVTVGPGTVVVTLPG
ncbi:hypothetical protein [Mumia sp. DW29H23]|uniref:hypothetical protein n=1 Tax=Mumia sp. DW29H23 TaxID=3421241 RepID=UPI003D68B641